MSNLSANEKLILVGRILRSAIREFDHIEVSSFSTLECNVFGKLGTALDQLDDVLMSKGLPKS